MNAEPSGLRAELRLADHVRTCVLDGEMVMLDLRRGRYLSVEEPKWRALHLASSHVEHAQSRPSEESAVDHRLLASLRQQGIFTTEPVRHRHNAIALPAADASLDVRDVELNTGATAGQLAAFVSAATLAGVLLRFRSLAHIAEVVVACHRRLARTGTPGKSGCFHETVAAFDRLRPLAFTAKDRCLYDSLALVLFLARRGFAAHWVIGVKVHPFSAHSWVQDGSTVLNDLHDNVRRFTPILVA